MKHVIVRGITLLTLSATLLTACEKGDFKQPKPNPVPPKSVPGTPVDNGFFTIRLKTAITVGDVVYDSIPSTIRILTVDKFGGQSFKDTTLSAGTQTVNLPKAANKYTISVNKWGVSDQVDIEKNEMVDGAAYTLGGTKQAKQLQSVTQYSVVDGAFVPSQRQVFAYDAQGRIQHIEQHGTNNQGQLQLMSKDEFIYDGNKLRVENVSAPGGVRTVWYHHAYTFDAQGRAVQSEYRYITQHEVYTNQFTGSGITMLMGEGASDPNGSRIALKFAGGNRVEEKTILPGYTTTVINYTHDFNINPYAVIKMPSLRFELASKNNVMTEAWEGRDATRFENSYDADGYVTQVITKGRNSNGDYVNSSKTVYTY